jgi:phage baseplate assembly protein W
MPNYKGFSTIDKDKKFSMVDRELIKRDLLNALLIRAGTLPGRPEVGTKIWDYIFDPNDNITSGSIEQELRRIIDMDKRLQLHELTLSAVNNTITAYVSVSILPDYSTEQFYINFSQDTQTATITTDQ